MLMMTRGENIFKDKNRPETGEKIINRLGVKRNTAEGKFKRYKK